jgi:nucleoside phosphorylase
VAPRIDALIITTADGEDDAVRSVTRGAINEWRRVRSQGFKGILFDHWQGAFQPAHKLDTPLTFALAPAFQMGTDTAALMTGLLAERLAPECVAMTGVCAGRPGWTELGDVVIADRVYRFDVGETVRAAGEKPRLSSDLLTYPLRPDWKQLAKSLSLPADASWLNERPPTIDHQELWCLHELLQGADPVRAPRRVARCPDWSSVVTSLQVRRLIHLDRQGQARLSVQGRRHIQRVLFVGAGQLPAARPWRIHVGPLGTGSRLMRDAGIWQTLTGDQRSIRGLDMEASVAGLAGLVQDIPWMVVKGVMDFGSPDRDDRFRSFASRAAAEVLIEFLRRALPQRRVESARRAERKGA